MMFRKVNKQPGIVKSFEIDAVLYQVCRVYPIDCFMHFIWLISDMSNNLVTCLGNLEAFTSFAFQASSTIQP